MCVVCACVCHVLCLHAEARGENVWCSAVTLSYSLQMGSLTQLRARLAASEPQ